MNEAPMVLQMILCEEVRTQPDNPHKVDVIGLLYRFRPEPNERPIRLRRLSVFLRLANGRGRGDGRIVFIEYDTGRAFAASRPQQYDFGQDPLRTYGSVFNILNCKFPHPGYYLVEFRYNGVVLAEQPFLVEA